MTKVIRRENVLRMYVNAHVTQELKVMKVKEADGSKCLILTLNKSDNALPEAVLNATAPVSSGVHVFLCSYMPLCASIMHIYRVVPKVMQQCIMANTHGI